MLLQKKATLADINKAIKGLNYHVTIGKMSYRFYYKGRMIGCYKGLRDTIDMANGILMFPNETPRWIVDYMDVPSTFERSIIQGAKGLSFADYMDIVSASLGEARARDIYERIL